MKVTVTKADIIRGELIQPRRCPVARGMRRALGIKRTYPFRYVVVNGSCAKSRRHPFSGVTKWRLPESAQIAQRRIDDLLPIYPFEFEAELAE